jgi:hypothetical protein
MIRMERNMSSTLHVRSIVASAFCVLDRYTSERFGRLRSTRGEGASGVSPCDKAGQGTERPERQESHQVHKAGHFPLKRHYWYDYEKAENSSKRQLR